MRKFNDKRSLGKAMQEWLHLGSRKFLASYETGTEDGVPVSIPYFFSKKVLADGVVEVFVHGQFYGAEDSNPTFNPKETFFFGYYLPAYGEFISCGAYKVSGKEDVLREAGISVLPMAELRKDLYHEVFVYMLWDANKLVEDIENPCFAEPEEQGYNLLEARYVEGQPEELHADDFKWGESLIEDRDVLKNLQGTPFIEIYDEIKVAEETFSEKFDALVNTLQVAEWLETLKESFQPTKDMQVRKAIWAEVRRFGLEDSFIDVSFDVKSDELDELLADKGYPDNLVVRGSMKATPILWNKTLRSQSFRAFYEPEHFFARDEDGDFVLPFGEVPFDRVRMVTARNGEVLLYRREDV